MFRAIAAEGCLVRVQINKNIVDEPLRESFIATNMSSLARLAAFPALGMAPS